MSELSQFPFKNQLAEPDFDGIPNINAGEDCLPTCLAAGLQFYLHKEYTGEELLHAVYGKAYQGTTAAINYVEYCAKQGVRLYAIRGNQGYLVAQIHKHLALGHPVIGTILSTYTPPKDPYNPGPSHCIIFYKDWSGGIAAMNPWQAFSQANSDAWWTARLCFGEVWILERKDNTQLDIPQGWHDDGKTLLAPNGKRVMHGFRSWVLAHEWHPDTVPLEDEQGAGNGATSQVFRDIELFWEGKTGVHEAPLGPAYLNAVQAVQKAEEEKKVLEAQVKDLQAKLQAPPQQSPFKAKLLSLDEYIQELIKQAS